MYSRTLKVAQISTSRPPLAALTPTADHQKNSPKCCNDPLNSQPLCAGVSALDGYVVEDDHRVGIWHTRHEECARTMVKNKS